MAAAILEAGQLFPVVAEQQPNLFTPGPGPLQVGEEGPGFFNHSTALIFLSCSGNGCPLECTL